MNKKISFPVAVIIIIVLAAIVGSGTLAYQYWWLPKEEAKNQQKPVACTEEAKLCSDGSVVGRTGPNCEFVACPYVKTGILKGKVTIGPLCPVEPCPATISNPYTSRAIILQNQTGEFFLPVILQEDGSFETEIGVGTYTLSLSECSFLGCSRSLPRTAKIEAGKDTEVEINIDTGIR
jgi:hypothetical protein